MKLYDRFYMELMVSFDEIKDVCAHCQVNKWLGLPFGVGRGG